ncbi:GNAT family N-acetyltransferase [Tropicimonas isoalkanivorans]|uniref:Protein N-acetyltransferase, RimJ/RimL family n=1 Tax=Tropicimonas isoalkanivorans TaxID=441112 RepID=A0A1I1JR78_9RHOB|nr:GNAT family N-acetyltransferase [Tropicimonas isoalkanivorans]SFC50895.1 Protein N-acetyltransferase, RimJ/RimL family [Tropicimonas isoalkanivorans]
MTRIVIDVPVLETDRLLLRAPCPADYPAYRAFLATERSRFTGGPLEERHAWRAFAAMIGHWTMQGFGMWTITLKGSDAPAGHAGLWYPGTWPEPEIGWTVYEGYEGKGIAFEAACAVRDHTFGPMGWTTAVSYIAAGNDRSVALARRLGAVPDASATRPPHAPDCHVFRHPQPGGTR